MKRTFVAGMTALVLASPSLSFAQDTPDPEIALADQEKPSADDIAAFEDVRIAVLKAGLKLTADQEKKWPALEAELREIAKKRAERLAARHERWEHRKSEREKNKDEKESTAKERPSPIARMRARADRITERATELRKLADAAEPLYQSLTDDQKRRFGFLLRHVVGHPGGPHGGFGPGSWGPPSPPFEEPNDKD